MFKKKAYTLDELDKTLKEKYNAKSFSVEEFKDLIKEISNHPENSVRLYIIDDEKIIDENLSDYERREVLDTIYYLKMNEIIIDYSTDEGRLEAKTLDDIKRGKLIRIIVESTDNITFTGFTMQGSAEGIYNELIEMLGDEK
ncbi:MULTISPECIES: hypothetical protein [unclassified Romboutsia]|uniref:hypothetical protein n=1 Tax=unclassified Romboutsia TaxID=2626894 RepID=UPI000820C1B1|nr:MULTISPECIES: hypothetical protein [unclassified Romboutsia]SCH51200.1 Uncharacterised protein [uncultured Clostridium sp.]